MDFKICWHNCSLCFPKGLILESSKLKEFADDNFKIGENGRKFIQIGRKHCGKKRNCLLRAICPFRTVFSKDLYCRHVKNKGLSGKWFSLNIFILHRLRNKFLQLVLISLGSASWELHQHLRGMWGPMKNPEVETHSRDSNSGPHDCKIDALPHDHGHHTG